MKDIQDELDALIQNKSSNSKRFIDASKIPIKVRDDIKFAFEFAVDVFNFFVDLKLSFQTSNHGFAQQQDGDDDDAKPVATFSSSTCNGRELLINDSSKDNESIWRAIMESFKQLLQKYRINKIILINNPFLKLVFDETRDMLSFLHENESSE